MSTEYYFSIGGVTLECGAPERCTGGDREYAARALRSDAEWYEWRERNPGVSTWRSIDGKRVAD